MWPVSSLMTSAYAAVCGVEVMYLPSGRLITHALPVLSRFIPSAVIGFYLSRHRAFAWAVGT